MAKTTFSVTVSDGCGGTRTDTRKSDHPYVACVVITIGAAYVASVIEYRARVATELEAARALFAARTAALGGMTPEVAQTTYKAANQAFHATFHALPEAEKEKVLAAAGGDLGVAAGLGEDGPFGLVQAHGMVLSAERRLKQPLPVAGEQAAVSWHSSRALAVRARDEKDARRANCAAAKDDRYEVRTDITAIAPKAAR